MDLQVFEALDKLDDVYAVGTLCLYDPASDIHFDCEILYVNYSDICMATDCAQR